MQVTDIHYTDGSVIQNPVVQIWEDLHSERPAMKRAFWCSDPEATTGSPVFGYCDSTRKGSHKTIKGAALEVWATYPDAKIYRNGKPLTNPNHAPNNETIPAGTK